MEASQLRTQVRYSAQNFTAQNIVTSICRVRAQTENENLLEVMMFCSTARARVMEVTMFCAMQVRGLLCAAHSGG